MRALWRLWGANVWLNCYVARWLWRTGDYPRRLRQVLGVRSQRSTVAYVEEAMTDNPRQDLEREAIEAAERWYPPGAGRLGGKLYAGKPAKEGFRERSSFQHGYIAAATAREKRIAELEDSNHRTHDILDAVRANEEHLEGEVLRLRAKLAAVPVEEIRECSKECRNTWPEEGIADDARAIDRWLATVTK